jgi:hypothetical protein
LPLEAVRQFLFISAASLENIETEGAFGMPVGSK